MILLSILSQVVLGYHADVSSLDTDHVNCEYQNPNCRCRENADVCEFEMVYPCRAVNCPFVFHPSYNINCTYIHGLRLLFPAPEHELTHNKPESDSPTLFFNFAVDGFGPHNSVNGHRLQFPLSIPAQIITDPTEYQEFVNHEVCRDIYNRELCRDAVRSITTPECNCAHIVNVPKFGKTTRFVLSNLGPQGDFAHPIHLHGHSFFVLHIGFPDYNASSGLRGCHNDDLNCFIPPNVNRCDYVNRPPPTLHYTCNNPEWNQGRKSLFGPAGVKIDPYTVRKDTVTVPAGGYIIIQFLSDNDTGSCTPMLKPTQLKEWQSLSTKLLISKHHHQIECSAVETLLGSLKISTTGSSTQVLEAQSQLL